VRILLTLEEHGQGRQMVRFRARPCYPPAVLVVFAVLAAGALLAGLDGSLGAVVGLGTAALILALAAGRECGAAMATAHDVTERAEVQDYLNTLGSEGK